MQPAAWSARMVVVFDEPCKSLAGQSSKRVASSGHYIYLRPDIAGSPEESSTTSEVGKKKLKASTSASSAE